MPCGSSSGASPTPTSATSAAGSSSEQPDGTSREPLYWRYELWVRESESALAGITAGNGAIYAVRREDYRETDPRLGHDLGFPYLMAQMGRRPVYEPNALAVEKAAGEPEDEFGRRVRMHAQGWLHLLSGRMLRPAEPLYLAQLVSHRVLRYASGLLHVALFTTSIALAGRAPVYRLAVAKQLAWLGLAAAGRLRPAASRRRDRLPLPPAHRGDRSRARSGVARRRAGRLGEGAASDPRGRRGRSRRDRPGRGQ